MFSASGLQANTGFAGGPIAPDIWKRAVYRPAPAKFSVEMLGTLKQGGSPSFGMRIIAIRTDNISLSSRASNSEYDVWRKWEDCLYFQETLELEYGRMAREKRRGLAAGKGVKKNGMYIQSDQAASFESLPPGPEPNSVARDVHDIVPRLTKKGTLFRPSQATTDQRQAELSALVRGLFAEDAPMLLQDLRASRTITDFFAYWRRDYDLAVKNGKQRATPSVGSRSSVSSSVFSMYFNPSATSSNPNLSDRFSDLPPSPSLSTFSTSPRKSMDPTGSPRSVTPSARPRTASGRTQGSDDSAPPSPRVPGILDSLAPHPKSAPAHYQLRSKPTGERYYDADTKSVNTKPRYYEPEARRTSPRSSSSSGSSFASVRERKTSEPIMPAIIVDEEVPIVFGHNPLSNGDRSSVALASLPEDKAIAAHGTEKGPLPPPMRRHRRPMGNADANRNARIFHSQSFDPASDDLEDFSPDGPVSRRASVSSAMSWQTMSSAAAAYMSGLNITLPGEQGHRARASVASMMTFRTDCSADAVVPRPGPRRPRPMSVPEGDWDEDDEDFYDAYDAYLSDTSSIRPASPSSSESRPETPQALSPSVAIASPSTASFYTAPSRNSVISTVSAAPSTVPSTISAAPSTSTAATSIATSSGTSPGRTITVKAALNGQQSSIIVVRTSATTTLEDIRVKLHDKFVMQERVPLSPSFGLLYIPPSDDKGEKAHGRARSGSMSNAVSPDAAHLQFITTQDEWEQVVESNGSAKLNLRVFNREKGS